jgi:hypothetical protein
MQIGMSNGGLSYDGFPEIMMHSEDDKVTSE